MPETERDGGRAPDVGVRGFSFSSEQDARGRLVLRALHHDNYGSICADWSTIELRRRIAAGRRQPLARALGLARRPNLLVVDATGGLGRDAYTLAALGARVILLERQPLVFALLQDAWRRAKDDIDQTEAAGRIVLHQADATEWLRQTTLRCDAVYLDPMYPDDGKTALPSKEMQILRELTAGDSDADALLDSAIEATRRVVVKRPRRAPALAGRTPDAAIHGTQLRFDLYLKPWLLGRIRG